MVRALRRAGLTLPLAALVGASTLLHWLASRRFTGLWIMPDEAIYGVRALRLWEHGSFPLLRGSGAGYSALYPLVAGGPLSIGTLSTGYALVKPVQALVMSLAAWPVYAYGRRMMPRRYALLAAALTLACSMLVYSGYLMTEVVSYPVATAALLATARAVESGTLRHQTIALALIAAAIATRVQAVVLLPVFAVAVLADALLAARRPRMRRFWPVFALLGIGAAIVLAAPSSFGAYASTLSGGYPIGAGLRLTYYHLAYLFVMVAVAPLVALVLMVVDAARGRARDPAVRALLAVAVCAVVLVVVQVGVFSSRYAPHLLGRDLAALPPILFCVFAVWLSRGAPRPRLIASAAVVATLAVIALAPWNRLVAYDALRDSPGIALALRGFFGWPPSSLIAVGAAIVLVLLRFAPRGFPLPLLVLALLVATSVVASNLVLPVMATDQVILVGTPRNWIDRAADRSVAFVYAGDASGWPIFWQQRFWNERIDRVVSIAPYFVPGPVVQRRVAPPPSGVLPAPERYVVANDEVAMRGTPVARQSRGPDQYGLTLWKVDPPAHLSTITSGVKPNGDMIGQGTVKVFGCAGGSLQLTLLPKATDRLEIDLDGVPVVRAHIGGLPSWSTTIPVSPAHRDRVCTFTIRGGLLLGSTHIAFAPGD